MGELQFDYGTHPLTQVDLLLTMLPALRKASRAYNEPLYELVSDKLIEKFNMRFVVLLSSSLPPSSFLLHARLKSDTAPSFIELSLHNLMWGYV
jgi:hypothetical protein